MPTRIGHTSQRHPLCPQCGYDVVATIDAGSRTCPECGEEFELHDVTWSAMQGEWTLLTGLRTALKVLLLRALIYAPIWAGLLLGLFWLMRFIGQRGMRAFAIIILVVSFITIIIAGGMIGGRMAKHMTEHFGTSTFLLPLGVSIFTVGVLSAATIFLGMTTGLLSPGQVYGVCFLGCGTASVAIFHAYFTDDM